jgi:hypothetical protein
MRAEASLLQVGRYRKTLEEIAGQTAENFAMMGGSLCALMVRLAKEALGDIEKQKCLSTTGTNEQVSCVKEAGHHGRHSDGRLIEWSP